MLMVRKSIVVDKFQFYSYPHTYEIVLIVRCVILLLYVVQDAYVMPKARVLYVDSAMWELCRRITPWCLYVKYL
jgi:hypothetical protein